MRASPKAPFGNLLGSKTVKTIFAQWSDVQVDVLMWEGILLKQSKI